MTMADCEYNATGSKLGMTQAEILCLSSCVSQRTLACSKRRDLLRATCKILRALCFKRNLWMQLERGPQRQGDGELG